MSEAKVSQSRAQLSDLPQEILHDITDHLDIHSSVQLASTASQYRIPAEKQTWSSLSITYKDLVAAHPRFLQTGVSPTSGLDLAISCSMYAHVVAKMTRMLDGAEWRSGMVKTFSFPSIDGVPVEILELLEKVSPSLEDLLVCTTKPGIVTSQAEEPLPLHKLFAKLSRPRPVLRRLRIAMKADLELILPHLLEIWPNINELHIHSQQPAFSNIPPLVGAPALVPMLPQTKVQKLRWDSPGDHIHAAAGLLRASPLIHHLQLLDVIFEWIPKSDDSLISAIRGLQHLVSLDVTHSVLNKLAAMPEALERLEHLSVTWGAQGIFEAKRNPREVVPPLPNLTTYRFHVSTYEPFHGGIHISTLFPHMESLRLLASLPLEVYASSPKLSMIYCSPPLCFDQEEEFPHIIPDWKDHAFQGIIVYSFSRSSVGCTPGQAADQTISEWAEELIHVRSHVATADSPCKKERCLVCPMGWEDRAWWRGIEVPIDVLGATYMAAGIHLGRLDHTRGLSMAEQGWKVMQYWYETREW